MTYVLHYAPDNASLIVRLALEEMALPYRTVLVDRSARAHQDAAYRHLNPAGLIPTLETPNGPIWETAAILLWLADRSGKMAPPPQTDARGSFLRMLFFISNTVHTLLRMTFYPGKYVGTDTSRHAQLLDHLQTPHPVDMTLPRAFALVDGHYATHGWDADKPTVLDYYVATLLRWSALYPPGGTTWFALTSHPTLGALAHGLETRPAVHAAVRAEGLGPTPFSDPRHPVPPEGTAT